VPNCMSFLVTETDRIHEIDERDLSNIVKRDFITFFPESEDAKENHAILSESLGENGTLHATDKNRVVQLKRGDFSA